MKKIELPPEVNLIPYILCGFSFTQILGILVTGFHLYQPFIVLLVLCFLLLIPGFLAHAGTQVKTESKLSEAQRNSFYTPSALAISILLIGFILGYWVGG